MTIRELRKKLGLTQLQLGHLLGVSNTTVWCWEAGLHRPLPCFWSQCLALADNAGVDLTEDQTPPLPWDPARDWDPAQGTYVPVPAHVRAAILEGRK